MTFGKGCGATFHTMTGSEHIFIRNGWLQFVLVSFLPRQATPNTVWAHAKPGTSAPTVSITPVSQDLETIAGEPELYLSTPDPEVSSVTFPPGAASQWMIHPAPVYVYVLEGTLTLGFKDGSHQSFHAGQGFLQCTSKWHRGRNHGSQSMRFLAVFFDAKGVPNVVHPEFSL